MNDDDAVAFLTLLFAPYDSGLIEVRGLKEGRVVREWFPVREPELAAKCAHLYDQDGYSAYFGVLPRIERGGKKVAVTQAAWLWADVDFKNTSPAKASLALDEAPADILVHSGHGWHCYYRLGRVLDISNPKGQRGFEKALAFYQKKLNSDPAVHNADRILRVPNTLNRKTLPIVKVRVLEWPKPEVTVVNYMFSRLLDEHIVLIEGSPRGFHEGRVAYTLAEVQRLVDLPPEEVVKAHRLKKEWGGEYIGFYG